MENLLSQYSNYFSVLREWVLALSVIPATVLMNSGLRSLIDNPEKWPKRWPASWRQTFFSHRLWPSISNIIYVLGLALIVELAPLQGRAQSWLASILFVLSVLLGLRLAQRTALMGVEWASKKARYDENFNAGFIPLFQNVITIFVVLTGGIVVLKHFNYDVVSLVTALGVSSLAVGLAAKDTISNMISGFTLIIDRNLKPGDRINLNGTVGDVKDIGLRSTNIRMTDGNTLIVPNSELVNNRILNLSVPTREISSSIQIRVPSDVPLAKIRAICLQITKQMEKLSKERSTWVGLMSLSDGHQLIGISIWVSDYTEASNAVSDFNEKLLVCLNQENIPLVTRSLI
jgi:MscS family membrane protein